MHEARGYPVTRGEPPQRAPHGRSDAAEHTGPVPLRSDERASTSEQPSAEPAILNRSARPLRWLLPLERQSDC